MTDHKWRKDRDGAESCEREGCTVRRSPVTGMWQKKRGGHWRSEREPIPPCAGKDAGVNALRPVPGFGMPPAAVLARIEEKRTPPAQSPLEVVRARFHDFIKRKTPSTNEESYWRSALATLEESIRADEREKCALVAVAEAEQAEKMWRVVKDERVAFGWKSREAGASLIWKRIRTRK